VKPDQITASKAITSNTLHQNESLPAHVTAISASRASICGNQRRVWLDSVRCRCPTDSGIQCDGLEDFWSTRTFGIASHPSRELVREAVDIWSDL